MNCPHSRRTRPDRDGFAYCLNCFNTFFTLEPISDIKRMYGSTSGRKAIPTRGPRSVLYKVS